MPARRDSSALLVMGRRVRTLRQERGYSQERLADEAQLHRTYISQVERGQRNVAVLNLLRLAQALRVDPGQLVEHLDRMHRPSDARDAGWVCSSTGAGAIVGFVERYARLVQ